MFTILGATGQVGSATAFALRRQGLPVRCLVRDEARAKALKAAGCDLVVGDVTDPATLALAFAGTAGVFVMLPPLLHAVDVLAEYDARITAIRQALEITRPRHVVVLSSVGADLDSGTGPVLSLHRLEAAVRQTGLPRTILRPASFLENWAAVLHPVQADGVLPSFNQPLDHPLPTVSTADIGTLAAECLPQPPTGERIVNLEGPAAYSPSEVAATFARCLNRPMTAVAPPIETRTAALIDSGIGPDYARLLGEMFDSLNAGRMVADLNAGELRHGTTTLETALARLLAPAQP